MHVVKLKIKNKLINDIHQQTCNFIFFYEKIIIFAPSFNELFEFFIQEA